MSQIPDGPLRLSPLDKKLREIEAAIGQYVPDFLKDYAREQEKKGFAEALLPEALSVAPGLGGLVPRMIVGGAAEAVVPYAIPGKKQQLSTLQPGDDIPLSQYPEGVVRPDGKKRDSRLDSPYAGKGPKGNQVGQDYDPAEPGIQGSGDPPGPAGRDLSRPSLSYSQFATDILEPRGITPGMYLPKEPITEDGAEVAAFAADSGFNKKESAAILGGGSVETVIDGDKPMETTINEPKKRGLSGLDAGSRAFLDYEGGSMGALRARDEALGLAYQGQNYYAIDRSADPDSTDSLVKLTEDQRRDITNRKSTAQDFLTSRLEGMKEAQSEVSTPAEAQEPVVVPEGFAAFNELPVDQMESALKKKGEELLATPNPQGIEDPDYAMMRDALFLKRKEQGLPF